MDTSECHVACTRLVSVGWTGGQSWALHLPERACYKVGIFLKLSLTDHAGDVEASELQ